MTTSKTIHIGKVLIAAGLISEGQRQTVLYDQQRYEDMKFGEILVTRGWLSQTTVDFFCEALKRKGSHPQAEKLGEHLAAADLLDGQQIQQILDEQRLNHLRFGSLAVLKGYISQQTLDFFLKYFCKAPTKQGHYVRMRPKAKSLPPNQETSVPRKKILA